MAQLKIITSGQPYFIATALFSIFLNPALAAEYSAGYSVEAGYQYNDNIRLSIDQKSPVSGGKVSLPFVFSYRSELLKTDVGGRLDFSRFDKAVYDSDDKKVYGTANRKFERGEADLRASYTIDSTRDTQFLDTGVVGLIANKRETIASGGSFAYFLTEKSDLFANVSYSDVGYESDLQQDYKFISGNFGWKYQKTARTELMLEGYFSRFEQYNTGGVESDSLGIQIGLNSMLYENLRLSILGGLVNTQIMYAADGASLAAMKQEENGYLIDVNLEFDQDRYRLSTRLSNQLKPSGSVFLLEDNQFNLNYTFKMTEQSRFGLDYIAGRSVALEENTEYARNYQRAKVKLDFQVSKSWYMSMSYLFSQQEFDNKNMPAISNAVFLSVMFKPNKIIWSG